MRTTHQNKPASTKKASIFHEEQKSRQEKNGRSHMRNGDFPVRGLLDIFALDYRAAMLVVLVDLMLFGGDALSFGLLIPLGIIVGAVLGFIVYKIQRVWCHDDYDSALIKAMIVGLLTAIPVPLCPLIAVPGGMLGLLNVVRRKRNRIDAR